MSPVTDLGDLFCKLYDQLSEDALLKEFEAWRGREDLRWLTAEISAEAPHDYAALAGRTEAIGNDQAEIWAALRGIEAVLAIVHPRMGVVPAPAHLAGLAAHVEARGRFDSGASGGALLAAYVRRARSGALPQAKREAFPYAIRVPDHSWRAATFEQVREERRFGRAERQAGLVLAASPLIADPDELRFDVVERDDRFYRIGPSTQKVTLDRVDRVVDAFDLCGAHIAVAPELCLTARLLERWQEALAAREKAAESTLQFALIGSGNLQGNPAENVAVLLDARTGEEIGRQRKRFGFDMDADILEAWNLKTRLGSEPINEDLDPATDRWILEVGGARLAVLICEDLSRTIDLGPVVRDFGVSHVLTPIFGRPTLEYRWERQAAEGYAVQLGSIVVVANSLVMHHLAPRKPSEGGWGTHLTVWPADGRLLVTDDPAGVTAIRVPTDGDVEIICGQPMP